MASTHRDKPKSAWADLIRLAGPHKGKMAASAGLAVAGEAAGIAPFILIYFIVAELAAKPVDQIESAFILNLGLFGLGAVVLKHLFLGASTLLSHRVAYEVLYDLRIRISAKLAILPLGYFNKRNTGQIKKVLLEDVEQMEIFLGHNLPDFFGAVITMTLTLAVLFTVDWRLGLGAIIVAPLGFLIQSLTLSRSKPMRQAYFTANENMNSVMIQYIQGMPIIKAFNHTVESFHKYSQAVRDCTVQEDRLVRLWFLPMSIFSAAIQANLLVLLPLGAWMYLDGLISLPVFVLFLLMGLSFANPLTTLMYMGSLMDKNLEGRERIQAVLDAEPLPEPEEDAPVGPGLAGRAVEFSYNGTGRVIRGIDFSASPGQFLALVGPSGAGKTTLARLIPRFWDVDNGSISLGGTDVRSIKLDSLMDRITFVFQNIHLFNDTVYNNLKMGRPEATKEEIEAAAKAARCHDFIMKLPHGYQTVIGERGLKMSGGEKQRLSIARALLKDAPIVVLDEATAFIDPENEILVQGAINRLVREKTLIVVAHRLSTVVGADEIMVIDKGRVAARGSHDQLLEHSDLYRTLWRAHTSARDWKYRIGGQL